jgi:hypothetical protein
VKRKNYDQAGLDAARTAHKVIDPVLKGLGSSAAPLVAASKIEQAGLQQRLKESRAADLGDLASRRVQAREGAAFAVSNARSDLVSGLAKIFQRQQDLANEKGAFAAATVRELRKAAQDRRTGCSSTAARWRSRTATAAARPRRRSATRCGRRGSTRTRASRSRAASSTRRRRRERAARARGVDKHLEWQTDDRGHRERAQRYKGKVPREQIVEKLKKGRRSAARSWSTSNGNPLSEGLTGAQKAAAGAHKVSLPAIQPYAPDLRMTAALDVALDGHLSPATQRKLRHAGFSVGQLNLPTYAAVAA